jgi:predicted O-methyltransferase YrrM
MAQINVKYLSSIVRKIIPTFLFNIVRSLGTALLTPILFSKNSGHFISSLRAKAVNENGQPIPWYTYPALDFLKYRHFDGKNILEFGGGQSSLWWGSVAQKVVSLEGDKSWHDLIKKDMPQNVELHYISMENRSDFTHIVTSLLDKYSLFDVVIVDGLYREEAIKIALKYVKPNGAIIVDNSEGYGIFQLTQESEFNQRIDFYGNAPGVINPHCTSIFAKNTSFLFDTKIPIIKIW